MKCKLLPSTCLAVILGAGMIVGVGSWDRRAGEERAPTAGSAGTEGSRAVSVDPMTLSLQSLDEQVIEAALLDLITASDETSKGLRIEQGAGKALFSCKDQEWVGAMKYRLDRAEVE